MTTYGLSRNGVLPIESKVDDEDREYITLSRTVNLPAGAGSDKRKARVPYITDGEDVESLLRMIKDFEDASAQSRLHLNSGTLRKSYFRQCLGETAVKDWD